MNLKKQFFQLSPREQSLLLTAAFFLLITLFYAMILLPLFHAHEKSKLALSKKMHENSWLKTEVGSLKHGDTAQSFTEENLRTINKTQKINTFISETKPSDGKVQLSFNEIPPEKLWFWLAEIEDNNGKIEELQVQSRPTGDKVKASVVIAY